MGSDRVEVLVRVGGRKGYWRESGVSWRDETVGVVVRVSGGEGRGVSWKGEPDKLKLIFRSELQ